MWTISAFGSDGCPTTTADRRGPEDVGTLRIDAALACFGKRNFVGTNFPFAAFVIEKPS